MPTYRYECEACDSVFELVQGMTEEHTLSCPLCDGGTTLDITGGLATIDKTPKTLGALADQNRTKFGEAHCAEREHEHKYRTVKAKAVLQGKSPNDVPDLDYTPPWRKGPLDKSLLKLDAEGRRKYVTTGKKD